MSFSFGFAGDDIEAGDETDDLVHQIEQCSIQEPSTLIPAKRHTLREMLGTLPSQISYNYLHIRAQEPEKTAGTNATKDTESMAIRNKQDSYIARRSVFDIRTQLMAEANPDQNDNDNLLAGLERGDLSSGIYEGGFKTWECAADLAALVSNVSLDRDLHVIELGAGSAIPSLMLLQNALRRRFTERDADARTRKVRLTLCDYNEDVLRLATVPNVFLARQAYLDLEASREVFVGDYDLEDIDETMVSDALKFFADNGISFDLISGAWGDGFLELLEELEHPAQDDVETLVLASETIYSPASIQSFADTVMQILKRRPKCAKAWIAAKRIYFGVGGGVEDFQQLIESRGGKVKSILEVKDAGVARIVLEITV